MEVTDARVERVLRAGASAPSVFNTQPWRVTLAGDVVILRADTSRQLRHADPHGREMLISCGAFLFNVRAAARRESLTVAAAVLPDPDDPLLVARLELRPGRDPDPEERELAAAITRRTTTRLPLEDRPLFRDALHAVQGAAHDEGAELRVIEASDPLRDRVLALVRRAEALAAADPAARDEEAAWTGVGGERLDGVPADALGPRSIDDEAPVRRFLASADSAQFETRSTMAVLLTAGDAAPDWVVAGEALEHLLLTATSFFVRASFATTVLENRSTRRDLRQVLGVEGHPQMLMRLGYGGATARTPRRAVP
ncbi:Acg family FMN-binding oxidoreductase [Promicromonospora kroppenstedtii]|uniref:Acg family FMN-binding oxidoreductase n=1 Tax=Promicromonospora kroppenstedtii TaxID=440482 RepID=A0ABW7XPU2_9MICO